MSVKAVGLDREAYDRLKSEKRAGESFSDVVKRLTRSRRPLTDFVGLWNKLPKEDVRDSDAAFEEVRAAGRANTDRAFQRMAGRRARR